MTDRDYEMAECEMDRMQSEVDQLRTENERLREEAFCWYKEVDETRKALHMPLEADLRNVKLKAGEVYDEWGSACERERHALTRAEEYVKKLTRLKSELTRVKGEVPCPDCDGHGGAGIPSDFEHPCLEDTDDPRDCDDYSGDPADMEMGCLHKEKGGTWETCSSGALDEFRWRDCESCHGTGLKYPEVKDE